MDYRPTHVVIWKLPHRKFFFWVNAEAQNVASTLGCGLDDQCRTELGLSHTDRSHLEIGNADVKIFSQISVPHYPDRSDEECAQIALKDNTTQGLFGWKAGLFLVRGQIPHADYFVENVFLQQE